MNIFDFIDNAFVKRLPVKPNNRQLDLTESYYMVNRWLSMSPLGLPTAWKTSKYSSLPRWCTGCYIYHKTPNRKTSPKLNYIKKNKEKKDNAKTELVKKVMSHYHCSETHAEEIILIYEINKKNAYDCFGVKK